MSDGLDLALQAISSRVDDLYALQLEDLEIVFRLPAVKTAKQFMSLLNMAITNADRNAIYEAVFRHVVQDDYLAKSAGNIPAGVPETIAKLVLVLSGLGNDSVEYTEGLYNIYRNQANDTLLYMKRYICSVFSGYTLEKLDELNYHQLVRVFIQAETLLIERGIEKEPHKIATGEQAKQTVTDMIKQHNIDYNEYERPKQQDPRAAKQMKKIREAAAERAKRMERAYMAKMKQQFDQ
jgi:hypothetical protein